LLIALLALNFIIVNSASELSLDKPHSPKHVVGRSESMKTPVSI